MKDLSMKTDWEEGSHFGVEEWESGRVGENNPQSEIHNPKWELTRREFLKTLGGGILVLVMGPAACTQERGRRGGGQVPQQINAWLHISPDNKITVLTGKVEVGQNARTSLTQAAAEELRVPIESIRLIMGDTDLVPFDMGTFGSRTTPTMIPQIRRAAAAARETLLDLAAEKWQLDRASLRAENGIVTDGKGSGSHSATYGELAAGQPLDKPISSNIALTPAKQWKTLGKSVPKVNGRDIVTGKHLYTSDLSRPGMLYGKVLRPPSLGATLVSVDMSAAEAMPGVKVVRDGEFVGVAAPTLREAERALLAIKAEWKETPQPSSKELFSLLKGNAQPATNFPPADKTLQATYTAPYIAHTPLEPRAALAEWDGTKMTVHTGTQRPFGVRSEVANALRIPETQVRVIVPDTGSGYGGKHSGDAAVEAARMAKAIGKPVKIVWTRHEEFTFAYFRPAGVIEISSGVRNDGTLAFWEFDNYNSGGAGIDTPYAVPNPRTQFHQVRSPLRQGSYRGLAATFNHFARETHMDELAHAVGMDPLAFRLKNLQNPRLRAVLEAAAERFGWGKSKPVAGRGFGLACGTEKGSYMATVVEVEVNREAKTVRVVRIVNAFECGAILNPEQLKNQVEGAVIMGLGGALFEAIEFENGKILTDRFSKYRVPRFTDVPPMETILLDRKDLPSAGAGETPIVAIAPAIGNAIFDAVGVKLRDLPLRIDSMSSL